MFATRLAAIVATIWAGSLWTIGYIVAPTLFSVLSDRPTAGMVAGALFRNQAWLSLACGLILLAMLAWFRTVSIGQRRILRIVIVLMLFCTIVGYFGLQPFMAELRNASGANGVMDGTFRTRFAVLHGVSSVFYLAQSLLAGVLIWKLR